MRSSIRLLVVVTAVCFNALVGCASEEPVSTDVEAPATTAALSEFDIAPRPVQTTSPEYPAEAKRAGATGTTQIGVNIDEEGRVLSTRIAASSGHPLLDAAAEAAARSWTFEPAKLDGAPVKSEVQIPFRFELN